MRLVGIVFLALAHSLIVVAAIALFDARAFGRDLDGRFAQSPLRDWYKAQRSISGAQCCDDADGHPVTEWGRGPGGYWVAFGGVRHDVPAEALVKGAHPQGLAVVWIYPIGSGVVRCFLPGFEG